MLPPETLTLVFRYTPQRDLVRVLSTSALFHHLAARVLYHALVDVPPRRTPRLLLTLAHNDLYAPLVRRLDLDWSTTTPTANALRLLHRALHRLVHLSCLDLEFPTTTHTPRWLLHDTPFSLRILTTSLRLDPALARFLSTQPDLVELCLRGFDPTCTDEPCALPTHALPRLAHFRTVLSSPHILVDVLRGRPVESVSMSVSPRDAGPSLDALLLSTRPVKRLTVMWFDTVSPATLITDIATRLPALEALHAVAPAHYSSHALLMEMAHALSHFTALRYFTLMVPGTFTHEDESKVATLWHMACPTLKTIILPKGVMWEYVDGRWMSLPDGGGGA